jgi:hypothetical protein
MSGRKSRLLANAAPSVDTVQEVPDTHQKESGCRSAVLVCSPSSLTTYGDFHRVHGVLLYRRRTAYSIDDGGSPRTVRVYRHENHDPSPLPDSIFVHPERRSG